MPAEDDVIISKRRLVDIRTMLHDAVELVNDALGYEPSPGAPPVPDPEPELPPAKRTGLLVPAYFNPATTTGATNWAKLAEAAKHVPLVAIANVSSGPGSSARPAYAAVIQQVVESGGKVIGYVPTGYGARDAQTVLREIDLWRGLYPQLSGIFLDEVSSSGDKADAYRGFVTRAKAVTTSASQSPTVVLNPGQPRIDQRYLDIGADVIVIYEGERVKPVPAVVTSLRMAAMAHRSLVELGLISYGCSEAQAADTIKACSTVGVRALYASSDVLANPFDTLPTYFDGEVAAIAESRP